MLMMLLKRCSPRSCARLLPSLFEVIKQLVLGKDDFAVQYNNETYKCFDELSMSKFTADPEAYLPQEETNDANIKPLILILGHMGMEKEML